MSLYTHWVCFTCRKSFHRLPLDDDTRLAGRCTECQAEMYDFGVYFQPPRRQAKKAWAVMQLLAEYGYKFQTEGSTYYINNRILAGDTTSPERIRGFLEDREKTLSTDQINARLKFYKAEQRRRS
jgi:DNA-directed RNA polymerase subunit RPC12/RpoP